ncbi:MAG: RNA polymerase sigma factor (sigma-70 family) [Neolewinella sp.]|jgi:RNA polymerase sigma factor (sigma-70 family)
MADINRQAQTLWNDFVAGDATAFRRLYDLTYDELYRYGHRLAGSRPAAVRDALQEVYLAIWQRHARPPPVQDPWLFLLVSLRNKLIDQARRERTLLLEADSEPSPEDDFMRAETEERRASWVAERIALLPDRQREALHLRYRVELEYEDVAEVMGVSRQVAYNYVNRGIKSLRAVLDALPKGYF